MLQERRCPPVNNTQLIKAPAAMSRSECALKDAFVILLSAPAAQFQGTSVSAFGTGVGVGTVATVTVPRVRPEVPQGLELKGHGQPATKQHSYIYNYNPAANGEVAVAAVGPPHREPV
jgi:hypothetical protein